MGAFPYTDSAVQLSIAVTIIIIIIIIIYNKEKTCTLIAAAIPADRNVVQKEVEKEVKIQEFMYRYITNVEPEMYDCTSSKWSHWNSNEKKGKIWKLYQENIQ